MSLSRYELPPVPPEGGYDVRFASGRSVEVVSRTAAKNGVFPIRLQSAAMPVRIQWTVNPKELKSYTLTVTGKTGTGVHQLTGTSEIVVNDPALESLTLTAGSPLPTRFGLEQNFPNPFNPSTTIRFELPKASMVTLKVYNTLGEVVSTMLENAAYDGGTYDLSFDASRLASGIYYYQLSAYDGAKLDFRQVKKFMLMK
jgi:hypothetical protein